MAQVGKGIMALPHLVGMASTGAAVVVGTVGMDGDKMKSISLDSKERERKICIMVTIQQLSNV